MTAIAVGVVRATSASSSVVSIFSELVGLWRADLDLEQRLVHISRSPIEIGGRLVEGPPKTSAGVRAVAIPPVLVAELSRHFERYTGAEAGALVFVGAKGAALRRSNFNLIWTAARDKVGRPDLHLHDLRHFANTLAASAGASTKELMARLGHASPAAALRYQHATLERDAVIAERMNDLIIGREHRAADLRVLRGGWPAACVGSVLRQVLAHSPDEHLPASSWPYVPSG